MASDPDLNDVLVAIHKDLVTRLMVVTNYLRSIHMALIPEEEVSEPRTEGEIPLWEDGE